MKTLPIEKTWSGDGYGANPITLRQVKRNETVALYERITSEGRKQGYEVFQIKKRLKGQALPGGQFEQEDREVYPSAQQFGKIAFNPNSLERANQIFDSLTKGHGQTDDDTEIEKTITVPVVEFTVKELADTNKIDYPEAAVFVKVSLGLGTIKFVREERRNAKGKLSKIYAKVV